MKYVYYSYIKYMWVCVGNKPSQTGLCLLYQLFIKLQMFNSYYCKKYNVYSIICAFVQMFMVHIRVSLVKLLYKYLINWQVVFGDFLPGIFIILCLFTVQIPRFLPVHQVRHQIKTSYQLPLAYHFRIQYNDIHCHHLRCRSQPIFHL